MWVFLFTISLTVRFKCATRCLLDRNHCIRKSHLLDRLAAAGYFQRQQDDRCQHANCAERSWRAYGHPCVLPRHADRCSSVAVTIVFIVGDGAVHNGPVV